MEQTFKRVRTQFTVATIAVAICCAAFATLGTYIIAENALQQKISAAKIGELAAGNSELSAYIASQQPNHAHFETIASIIQKEERAQLNATLPMLLGAVFVASAAAGWLLSRKLLTPVKESYLAQRRFMQDAAHELRNPLAAMRSVVQQAQNNPPSGQQLKKFINAIDRQANLVSAITTDLLLLEHREYPGKQQVNLAELLGDVIEELHHQAVANKVQIDTQIPSSLVAQIDPQHFVYIAKNMIENAIKFSTPTSKPVEVRLQKNKSGWRLVVKDYGIGIPKEDIPNITQRFYRAHNATQTDGTGLGMAIVAKFVGVYKGELAIKSSAKNGTTISVSM